MIQEISDGENLGFGVRVLINGMWGFASSAFVNEAEVAKVTELACQISKANSVLQKVPVELVSTKSYVDKYNTSLQINPLIFQLQIRSICS